MGEAEVGGTKNIPFQNQTGVIVQRRVQLVGYEDALRTIGREHPDLVEHDLGHVDVAFPVQFDPIERRKSVRQWLMLTSRPVVLNGNSAYHRIAIGNGI